MADQTFSTRARLSSHLFAMPRWHKTILALSVLLTSAGIVGTVANRSAPSTQPSNSQGGAARSVISAPTVKADDSQSIVQKYSPGAVRLGISILVAFIVGWLFRTFLKIMLIVTLLVGGTLALLSYFKILNVDLTSAQGHYESAVHWLEDQSERLKGLAVNYLPSNIGKLVGFYLGFKRHKS